jgi:hypothetical protein
MTSVHPYRGQNNRGAMPRLPYKTIVRLAASLAAIGLVTLYAFVFTFTSFGHSDDDGYFLQAYREFLSGRIAYDQIVAMYGPFTFYSGAVIARFKAVNVTHDAFRWALLPAWIAVALLMAGVIWRWAGRFSPALAAFLLLGLRLGGLVGSVGHPQVWIILVVAFLLWLGIDWIYLPNERWRAFWTGFLLAAVLLFKTNIGIFVFIAIGLAGALQLEGLRRRLSSGVFLIAAIGLSLLIFLATSTAAEKYFSLVYILALVGVVALSMEYSGGQRPSLRSLLWLMAGLGICFLAGVGSLLHSGTSVLALFRGLIVYPALLAKTYHQPFEGATHTVSIIVSILGLGAVGTAFCYRHIVGGPRAWVGVLKLTAGAGLVCAFIRWPHETLTGSLLFLPLLLVDDPPVIQRRYANRVLLTVTCLLFSLQLFPVAGTQLLWAELLPIVAAALLIADGANSVERDIDKAKLPCFAVAFVWAGPVLALLLFIPCAKAAVHGYRAWHGAKALGLPGAYWLRLTPLETARLTIPVNDLRRYCSVVLTVPGMYSYSIWSGVQPIEEKRINAWPFLFAEEVQERDLPNLRQHDRGCVLVNYGEYGFFKSIAVSPGDDRLLTEIQRAMSPVASFQDIVLYRVVGVPGTIPHSDADTHPQKPMH